MNRTSAQPLGLVRLAGLDAEQQMAGLIWLASRLTGTSLIDDSAIEDGLVAWGARSDTDAIGRVRMLLQQPH